MKKILLILALLGIIGFASARPVGPEQARNVAINYLMSLGKDGQRLAQKGLVNVSNTTPFHEFYTFTGTDGLGFVLVAVDDCSYPILGYSCSNSIVTEDIPEHILAWLRNYEVQISNARQADADPSPEARSMWNALTTNVPPVPAVLTSVSPLLTTTWNQAPYYNDLCPFYSGSNRSVTGCVATAVAQVMNYWQWPVTGQGSNSYTYGSMSPSADFGNTTYDWANMPNALTASSSATQKNAVATLIYHVGVSINMQYGPSSGAYTVDNYNYTPKCAENALRNNFRYNPALYSIYRADFTDEEWCSRLRSEIDLAHPVIYSGRGSGGGHCFVLDGYNNNNLFHVNWGWGGYYDGYFAVGGLNPYGGGIGTNDDNSFNDDNSMLVGVYPATNAPSSIIVNAAPNNSAWGSVSGSGTYSTYITTAAVLTATAYTGYRFKEWSDGSNRNYRRINGPGANINLTAIFEPVSGDTLGYCFGNQQTSYASGSAPYNWGIKLPSSVLTQGRMLTKVQAYISENNNYTINIYTGSTPTTLVSSQAISTYDVNAWNTFTLNNPVIIRNNETLWITLSATNSGYPISVSDWGGENMNYRKSSGSTWSTFNTTTRVSFMIRGIFCDTNYVEEIPELCDNSTTTTFGDENNTTNQYRYPVNNYFKNSLTQTLVTSSELGGGKILSKISFKYTGTDPSTRKNYCRIYIQPTSLTSITGFVPFDSINAVMVYDGSLNCQNGWNDFHFSQPYHYDGSSNLIIMVVDNNDGYDGNAYTFAYCSTPVAMSYARWSDYITMLLEEQSDPNSNTHFGRPLFKLTACPESIYDNQCLSIPDYHRQLTPSTSIQYESSSITSNCHKMYRIPVLAGRRYTFATASCVNGASANFDTKLYLYNSIGVQLTSNDDNCGSLQSKIEYTPFSTDYLYLKVCGYSSNSYGDFTLAYKVESYNRTYHVLAYDAQGGYALANDQTELWVDSGSVVNVVAYPSDGYHFTRWSDGNTTNPRRVTVTRDMQFYPSFSHDVYRVTLNVNDTAMGRVSGAGTFNYGTNITIIATPREGYRFKQWQNTTRTSATFNLTVTNDTTFTAVFEPITYRLSVVSDNEQMGLVSGSGNYPMDSYATVTATPRGGYRFVNWSDGSTENPHSVHVIASRTITAYFEADPTCGINTADLPYVDGFESYTTSTTAKTYVEPTCWMLVHRYVSMTMDYVPMVYYGSASAHTGNYSLLLNKKGIYAMPRYQGNVSDLKMSFFVKQSSANYLLQVGVMSDRDNYNTFVPVKTINNSGTGYTGVEVDFSTYTGNGQYIAFKNYNSDGSSSWGCNYIDDLRLELRPTTVCGIAEADLPYTENFDSYTASTTAKTGIEPACWTLAHKYVSMTADYEPMLYYGSANAHSGNYSLLLNKKALYAMPRYEGNVSDLEMSFFVKQSNTNYQLQVGVMSDLSNPSTFVPVAAVNNNTTNVTAAHVDFSIYNGNGHYIVFKNTNSDASSVWGCNYIDDIRLELHPTTPGDDPEPSSCDIAVDDLPYLENFDHFTTVTTAKTGVEPTCWTLVHKYVTMTSEYEPMLYRSSANAHSGDYSLLLNKKALYAMPRYEGNIRDLKMTFYVKQSNTNYQLQVGVLSDINDQSTFVPVKIINNANTNVVAAEVDFVNYNGDGKYIAFKNTNVSSTSEWGCNYIDDIRLEIRAADPCVISSTDLPYTENFDSYTTSTTAKTGVKPNCWTLAHKYVSMTADYEPMLYYAASSAHSGNYSLLLNKKALYAMPFFDGNVRDLKMTFYVKQSSANYQLQVGVMSNLSDPSSFIPVKTINNANTNVVAAEVDFGSYNANGHYIAFKNTNASSSSEWGCNYIDDIRLELRESTSEPVCSIAITDLPYTEDFDTYTTSTTAKTGVEPNCWTLVHKYVTMTADYEPMLYYSASSAHSGNYSLLLNKKALYAMPRYEDNVRDLTLSFYLKQSSVNYQLEVGVMTDVNNKNTFVPVATINNPTTDVTSVRVDFTSYTGNGHYIAFKNINADASSVWGCNYIDDLRLELTTAKGAADFQPEMRPVSVYPNPTTGLLTVEAQELQKVEVYDFAGRRVAVVENSNIIDLTDYASGIYALRITSAQGTEVRKVVKN